MHLPLQSLLPAGQSDVVLLTQRPPSRAQREPAGQVSSWVQQAASEKHLPLHSFVPGRQSSVVPGNLRCLRQALLMQVSSLGQSLLSLQGQGCVAATQLLPQRL
jgi:hypothetical protein